MPVVLKPDPFNATLLTSESLAVSLEQRLYIRKILDVSSSDSAFARKAYAAIEHVLTAAPAVPPVITSLSPSTAAVGDASFTLHVNGTGFTPTSVIMFNGLEEPTTFVNATDLSTGVNMPLWVAPVVVPVSVVTDGVASDPMTFEFTDVAADTSARQVKKNEVKKEVVVSERLLKDHDKEENKGNKK